MKIPLTIKETQEGLINKDFSAVDLIDSYLERIDNKDKEISSLITVCRDEAYKKAKVIDNLLKINPKDLSKQYPLLGSTVIFKDNNLTKGVRTTAGSKVLESYVPAYSATAVKRILNAGSIMLGKANMDAWAHGSSGENSDFGFTKNPWNLKYVPGGSSSGSGAALAANFGLISTGSDTCGSIRLPANYCYTYGLKPTYGSVPRYGIIAMASSLDSIGHFSRTVDGIRKVFAVTKGLDFKDSTMLESKTSNKKTKLKIGIPKEFFIKGLDKEVEQNISRAISIFKKLGHQFIEVSMPTTEHAISVYYIIQPAEVSSNLARYDGIRYGKDRKAFSPEAKRRIMLGAYVLSSGYYDAYYLKAMQVRSKIIQDVETVFKKVDLLIAPVAPTPPFKIGEKVNDPLQMYLTDIFAATANLSGIPSLAVPFNFSKEKLPLGFQLMGPQFSEELIFNVVEKFEKESGYQAKVAE